MCCTQGERWIGDHTVELEMVLKVCPVLLVHVVIMHTHIHMVHLVELVVFSSMAVCRTTANS